MAMAGQGQFLRVAVSLVHCNASVVKTVFVKDSYTIAEATARVLDAAHLEEEDAKEWCLIFEGAKLAEDEEVSSLSGRTDLECRSVRPMIRVVVPSFDNHRELLRVPDQSKLGEIKFMVMKELEGASEEDASKWDLWVEDRRMDDDETVFVCGETEFELEPVKMRKKRGKKDGACTIL